MCDLLVDTRHNEACSFHGWLGVLWLHFFTKYLLSINDLPDDVRMVFILTVLLCAGTILENYFGLPMLLECTGR